MGRPRRAPPCGLGSSGTTYCRPPAPRYATPAPPPDAARRGSRRHRQAAGASHAWLLHVN
eukprot:232664-Chlamydomonas_euryale.AAC.1